MCVFFKCPLVCLYLVVVHVFAVPVALQPMLRRVLLHKVTDSVPEVIRLQQKQLDYEVADLSLVSLVAAHRLQAEDTRRHSNQALMSLLRLLQAPLSVLTRHRMSLSRVTMLYFQTMSLRISMHLLSC